MKITILEKLDLPPHNVRVTRCQCLIRLLNAMVILSTVFFQYVCQQLADLCNSVKQNFINQWSLKIFAWVNGYFGVQDRLMNSNVMVQKFY